MEGQDIRGLFEAYSKVYETTEVLNEEIVEEGVEQLMERGAPTDPKARAAYDATVSKNRVALGNTLLYGNAAGKKPEAPITRNRNVRGGGVIKPTTPATKPAASPKPAAAPAAKPAPAPATSPKPAAAPVAKPAASAAPKPTAPSAPAKPAGSAMDAWAKANPKLAQAQKIRKEGGSRAEVNKVLYNKGTAAAEKTPTVVKAGVDIFDLIKGHLLGEGYAETEENALVMMANMSEDWRSSILESYGVEILDEAQEARENPEKHEEDEEKENEKKYGKVRGEKTPMPPRGDKRREDFEKWYAKNVR
jgi:outer membrane biosynthesis protein TonB